MGSATITDITVRHMLSLNVRHHLDRLGWSESELARRSGVSQKQINNIIKLRYGCSVEALFAIARGLKVPPFTLIIPGRAEVTAVDSAIDEIVYAFLNGSDKKRQSIMAACRGR